MKKRKIGGGLDNDTCFRNCFDGLRSYSICIM